MQLGGPWAPPADQGVRMETRLAELKYLADVVVSALDPLSKAAQVVAVVIAGIWTFHLHEITGEGEYNPEVWVSTEISAYSKDARLLVVHIREKNVGKVAVELGPKALSLAVKKIPESVSKGFIDMDKQPTVLEVRDLFKRYDRGTYMGPGSEFEDVAQFVVPPGLYNVEATLSLADGDTVNDVAFRKVE